jgi:hypothetical protein
VRRRRKRNAMEWNRNLTAVRIMPLAIASITEASVLEAMFVILV